MEISVLKSNLCEVKADVLILPVYEGEASMPDGINEIYDYAKNELGLYGKYLENIVVPTFRKIAAKNVLFVGLGKSNEFADDKLTVAISKAFQKAQGLKKVTSGAIYLDNINSNTKINAKNTIEGALIGLYKFDKYKSEKKEDEKISNIILVSENEADANIGIIDGKLISSAVNFTRDLINEPAEIITPQKLAQLATGIDGIETKVCGRLEAKDMGMGAFLAVGQGSRHEQQFIHMHYTPSGAKSRTVAIIGKGITFDSGGLDLKPAASMLEMKGDMAGAAAILAVMRAISIIKPDVEVHGIIAACENMPNSAAYKPGDILTAMNGKTIEVDNTDAEGRLTLADALCYAENLKPDAIIDIATLTGACCVALGKVASGLLGNNAELIAKLRDCAKAAGEYLWEMPMYDEYFDDLKSDIADFKNSGSRYGGTSAAALFLKNFVRETPWAHIDIAGTSIVNKPLREYAKGPTGVGVRTLLNYICNL